MKTTTLSRLFTAGCLYFALLGWASAGSTDSTLVDMGDNTYSVTREAKTTFNRNTKAMRAEAEADAAKFCTSHGKQLKIVSVSEDRPFYTLGFCKVRIIFKALDAGDPALTAQPAPVLPEVKLSRDAAPSGDYYTELLKLDDLRKRGILTDKEFEQQKKKILKHAN